MRKFLISVLTAAALSVCGCSGPSVKPTAGPNFQTTPPATVHQISDELELATVRLTTKSEKRLGITVATVKKDQVPNRRTYAGITVLPPQNATSLLAPAAGVVRYIGPSPLAVGTAVSKGQPLFSLIPLATQDDFAIGRVQLDQLKSSRLAIEQSAAAIESRISTTKVALTAAQIEERRSVRLFEQKIESQRRVDEARARTQLAQETLEAAIRERQTLQRIDTAPEKFTPSPLEQVAPINGTILRVQVSSGQTVSASQPMLDLVDLGRLLLRVRVPLAEASQIARGEPAVVGLPGSSKTVSVTPVKGPPTADQTSSTIDLYYVLDNHAPGLNPDQRVEVVLPLEGSGSHLVVPTGSILYDVHGGAWVYVRVEPLVYKRVRAQVELSHESGQTILESGPQPGQSVVIDGAAEIFGIEFGND